jgi:hypothetical protein
MFRNFVMAVVVLTGSTAWAVELQVSDFKFNGELGSAGAVLTRTGANRFQLTLDHAPTHDDWANKVQFEILHNAAGNNLRLDVKFNYASPNYFFDEYKQAFSYDGDNWTQLNWSSGGTPGKSKTLTFPTFTQDYVKVGSQIPLPYDKLQQYIAGWSQSPSMDVNVLGQSTQGRNLYRLTITDADTSDPSTNDLPVLYFSSQHPLEGSAQHRMVGMIDWLLSAEGAAYRRGGIYQFVINMSPDGPSNGWFRTNASGVDMNRTYRVEGSSPTLQTHEPYVLQKDLEDLMASDHPVTAMFGMHTAADKADPAFYALGPEIGGAEVGPWTDFKALLAQYDTQSLFNPVYVIGDPLTFTENAWNIGPNLQFGITTFLMEGAGDYTKQKSLDVGATFIHALGDYYHTAIVPEPSSLVLLATGAFGLLVYACRKWE